MDPTVVILSVAILTSEGKPNLKYREPMPSMEVCVDELKRFLLHKLPELIEAKRVMAQCEGPVVQDAPS